MTASSKKRRGQSANVSKSYSSAKECYAAHGVDTDNALALLAEIPVSLHCWQGDDVTGFEKLPSPLGGGIAVTGNYPGKATTPDELRADAEVAFRMIPGMHRFNLHASYGEFRGQKADRNEVEPGHFSDWISWARSLDLGLDFNPTFFSHPLANDGFTLSHRTKSTRDFWIEHGLRCREIGEAMGKALGKTCVTNFWIPDGYKDNPADRVAPRERLTESLDKIFKKTISKKHNLDAVEPKLFGLGSECYVAGSHEYYFGYAMSRGKLLCLDAGHYHPTESIADKISSVLQFMPEILLHVSRGVRWDSDHVVTLNDDLLSIAREIVANGYQNRVRIGLDYFDASINRVAAWTAGTRNMLRALLIGLLEPPGIRQAELEGDYTSRLALQEEAKMLPAGAVWDIFCETHGAPKGVTWLQEVKRYERDALLNRS